MSEVKHCPKCSGRMARGSDESLNDYFRCTRPTLEKLEQNSCRIQSYYCQICGYIEFYRKMKEKGVQA